jgi:hypothetical protein
MTTGQLIELLQQYPEDTVVVLPPGASGRYPKLASVSYIPLEFREPEDEYYDTDPVTQRSEMIWTLTLNA